MRSPCVDAVAPGRSDGAPAAVAVLEDGGKAPPAGTAPGAVLAVGTSSVGPCGALPAAAGCVVVVGAGANSVGLPLARCQCSYSMNSETEKMIQRMVRRVSIGGCR